MTETGKVKAKIDIEKMINNKKFTITADVFGKYEAPIKFYQREKRVAFGDSEPEEWTANYDEAIYELADIEFDYESELEEQFKDYDSLKVFLDGIESEISDDAYEAFDSAEPYDISIKY